MLIIVHILLVIHNVICVLYVFFFNDTATTEIYTLSLHDALPIFHSKMRNTTASLAIDYLTIDLVCMVTHCYLINRSEEHTSELQSRQYLVCRLLLEKKNKKAERDLYKNIKPPSETSLTATW